MSNDSQVTTLDDAPATITPTQSKAAKGSAKMVVDTVQATQGQVGEVLAADEAQQFYNVTVHPTGDESGSDVVEVCVNGFLTRLPRGVPCRVSASVLHVLENAVVTTYKVNGDQVVERNVPRFPFSATPAA